MDNELQKIFDYLSARHFHASREWVKGCVDYFREQHERGRYSYSQMQEFVTQQWELADLREISPGCLPPNLTMQKKTVLSGKYSLQVESLVDIAKSCYSQIQAIRNVPLENVKATEIQRESWEPSAKRVLQLSLCDGVQEIRAIEYKPIKALDRQIVPGFKILIVGPVDCRRGIVLLNEHNLQLIGGEVDSLLIPNALENVLARALNIDENPDPYNNSQNMVPTQTSTNTRNDQQGDSKRRIETEFFDDDDDIFAQEVDAQLEELEQKQNMLINSRDDITVRGAVHNEADSFEEAYQREIEMMDMNDDDLESIEQQPLFDIPKKYNVAQKQTSSLEMNQSSQKSIVMETDLLEDDDIFLHVSDADLELTPELNKSIEIQENKKNNTKLISEKYQSKQAEVISLLDDSVDDSWLIAPGPSGALLRPRGPITGSVTRPSKTWKDGSNRSQKSLKAMTNESTTVKTNAQPKISSFFATTSASRKKQIPEIPKNVFCSAAKTIHTLKETETGRPSIMESHVQLEDTFNSVDDLFANVNDSVLKPSLIDQKIQSIPSTSSTPTVPCVVTDSEPFVYIQQLKDMKITINRTYTVKAFILTLKSFLRARSGEWFLPAKLCDGSATMDVQFSSDLLDSLIGYSVNEARKISRDADKNPLLNERLTKALKNAQQKLIELNALFTLSFSTENAVPNVIEINEITEEHLKTLKARVKHAHSVKKT